MSDLRRHHRRLGRHQQRHRPRHQGGGGGGCQAARTELLPEATGFTLVEGEFEGVTEIYTADNGVGTIITSSDKGYSSTVVVMVPSTPTAPSSR